MPYDLDTVTPTGHEDLDEILGGGLHRGHLTGITGPVSSGKTMLTLGLARHAAIRIAHPAFFASTESGPDQIMEYVLCAEARVRFGRRDRATADELQRARALRDTIVNAPLRMDSVLNCSLERLALTTMKLATERGLRLLVVDYIQLLGDSYEDQPWAERVEATAVGLKRLARAANIAVVAVSTMRSQPAKANGLLHPAMFDLGDAETFERNADELIIVHREELADPNTERAGLADLIVAKNRTGLTGTATIAFQPHFARFIDMARS